jgi:hypothetical protein
MTRSLGSALVAEVTADTLKPIVLVKMEFDEGDLNLWNGIGELIWDGDTYAGAGALLGISEIEGTANLQANGVNISLNGIPSAILSLALSSDYQNRPASIWLSAIDSDGLLVTPYLIFKGLMDSMTISEDGQDCSINLAIENELVTLERPRVRNYTPEDQGITFSGDKGLDFIASLQNAEITWGR